MPVRLRLSDGAVQPHEGDGWPRVHARLAELMAQRQRDWQQYRAQRAQPLSPRAGDDPKPWRGYMVELRDRFNDEEHRFVGMVLQARDVDFMEDEDGVRDLVGMLGDREMGADRALIVSPDSARLSRVLAKALTQREEDSCRGSLLAVLATAEEFVRLEEAAARCGLQ